MKKSLVFASAFLAMAVGFISCSKEVNETTPENGYTYTFTIADDNTRATLDDEGVAWEENDRVGMFLEGYTGYANVNNETTPKSVILYSASAIPADSYAYAYYPYNSSNSDKTAILVNFNHVQQGGATSAMPMAGIPFLVEEEVEAKGRPNGEIKFLNLGAIIDFKIYSADYSDETIQYVTFQADGSVVSGDAYIDLTGVSANDESSLSLTWKGEGNEYDYVKVNQETAVAASKDEATSIYMVVAPGTYSGTITIGTDVATYTFTFTNKELGRNILKHYNMNLSGANRVAEVVEVVKTLPYEEAFTSGQGDFSIQNVTLPDGQSSIWTFDASYGAKVTAYFSASYASESWLISPWIDLTEVSAAAVSFDHVHRYAGTAASELTFWAMSDDEDAEWEQLTIPNYATGTNWTYVNSGETSLASYIGKKVKVAFKYISSTSAAATWEIKNFSAHILKSDPGLSFETTEFEAEVGDDFTAPTLVNPNNLTVTYSSSNSEIAAVDENTGEVVIGEEVGIVIITASFAGNDEYNEGSASYTITVTDPNVTVLDFTWDLTKASYSSASTDQVSWQNDNVSMVADKANASTNANNYLPTTYNYTRFYAKSTLTFTPADGVKITKVEYTAKTDNYATALSESTWTNASVTASGTVVTIIPDDGSLAFSATISATTGASAVKVYYTGGTEVVETEYTITISETTNGTVAASAETATAGTEITLTVSPDDNYELESLSVVDSEGNAVSVTNNKFTMPAAAVTVTATFKAASTTTTYYTKVTSTDDLTSGTYLIVYEDGSLAFNGGLTTLDAVSNTISVTIDDSKIESTATTNAAAFTYDASAGTLKSASGKYIGNAYDSNALTASDTELTNTISFDSSGNANVVSSGGAYLRYNAASNQARFRYYKSGSYTGQKAIQLYKLN